MTIILTRHSQHALPSNESNWMSSTIKTNDTILIMMEKGNSGFKRKMKLFTFSTESVDYIIQYLAMIFHQEQGTYNYIGSTLFFYPKSKQIICFLEG
jgi:hypothetical protein